MCQPPMPEAWQGGGGGGHPQFGHGGHVGARGPLEGTLHLIPVHNHYKPL